MFKHICVPVDNSDHSNRAIDLAVELGRACGTKLTGIHVYAARLHDYRFKQMEYTLPEEYKDENELERQRKIHDSLIAMGLQLISESYLDVMARKAVEAGLAFEPKMIDGKHYKVLVEDCLAADYDLVVMGALGMGAVKDSQLGSVTERFVRRVTRDTLIVRNASGHLVERVLYTQSLVTNDGSLTRSPDLTGPFVTHSAISTNSVSPGTRSNGAAFSEPAIAPPTAIVVNAKPGRGQAILLEWNVDPGRAYSVLQAAAITGPFTPLKEGLRFPGNGGQFTDTVLSGVRARFYLITTP